MQHFIKHRTVFKCHMWMGAFGADTPKGTHLWAPDACVSKFSLPLPNDKELVTKKVLPDGGAQATGNSALKGNQSYPPAFGHATVGVWKLATKRLQPLVNASLPKVWASRHDKWSDADLAEVLEPNIVSKCFQHRFQHTLQQFPIEIELLVHKCHGPMRDPTMTSIINSKKLSILAFLPGSARWLCSEKDLLRGRWIHEE